MSGSWHSWRSLADVWCIIFGFWKRNASAIKFNLLSFFSILVCSHFVSFSVPFLNPEEAKKANQSCLIKFFHRLSVEIGNIEFRSRLNTHKRRWHRLGFKRSPELVHWQSLLCLKHLRGRRRFCRCWEYFDECFRIVRQNCPLCSSSSPDCDRILTAVIVRLWSFHNWDSSRTIYRTVHLHRRANLCSSLFAFLCCGAVHTSEVFCNYMKPASISVGPGDGKKQYRSNYESIKGKFEAMVLKHIKSFREVARWIFPFSFIESCIEWTWRSNLDILAMHRLFQKAMKVIWS